MNRFVRTITALTFFSTLAATAEASAANVTVRGGAHRGNFRLAGRVIIKPDQTATGHFSIAVLPPGPGNDDTVYSYCRYTRFSNARTRGRTATFDMSGECTQYTFAGGVNTFAANNRVTITDNGANGDVVDVNFLGASGVAVPGGPVQVGGFIIQ